jgi:hypothetical protein
MPGWRIFRFVASVLFAEHPDKLMKHIGPFGLTSRAETASASRRFF